MEERSKVKSRQTTLNVSPALDRQIDDLGEWGYGNFTTIITLAVDRMYRQEASRVRETNLVKITKNDKPRCPVHGEQNTEYKAQDPAPCGCAWVWEDGKLIAAPGRSDWVEGDRTNYGAPK